MRLEAVVAGVAVLAIAAGAAVTLWLQQPDPVHAIAVQALGEPQERTPPPATLAPAGTPLLLALHFDYDRAVLRPADAHNLERWLHAARTRGFKRIDAVGHAGRIGRAEYNKALSQRRADAVKAYLVKRSVVAADVRAAARGELEPVSGDACIDMGPERRSNAGLVECLQADRRVEVSIVIDS